MIIFRRVQEGKFENDILILSFVHVNMKNIKQQKKSSNPLKKPAAVMPGVLKERWVYIILFAFTFVLYANTLSHDYALDDAIVITDNMFTQKGFAGIKDILTHDTFLGFFKQEKNLVAGGRYRPLSLVTFAVEWQFFGRNPGVNHFFNILFYALTGVLIFLLLKRLLLLQQTKYSYLVHLPFIAALVFIALPVHTEAVANIKGRDEILSMLFSLAAAHLFLKYIDEGKKRSYLIWGAVCLFLGLLSKENAITFFLIIPMMIWFFRKPETKDYIPVMTAVIISSAVFLILRQSFTNTSLSQEVTELMNNPFYGMTAAQKYSTIVYTFIRYLSLIVLPVTLTHDYYPYQITVHNITSAGTIISFMVCAAGLALALLQLKKRTLLSFCILFFVFTFSVVSNLVFPVGTFMSERFVFMPSLAYCIMLAYFISLIPLYKYKPSDIKNQENKKELDTAIRTANSGFFSNRIIQIVLVIVIGGYAVRTVFRNPAWKDNFTLFLTDIHNSPNSAKLNNAAGGELLAQSDKDTSEEERIKKINQAKIYLNRAIKIYPLYNNAYLLLGNAYLKGDKNFEKALEAYNQALRINPNYGDALQNMTVLFNNWTDVPKKISALKNFIKEQPGNMNLYSQLGTVYNNAGQYDSAIIAYKKEIELDPKSSNGYNQIGMIYGKEKNMFDSSIYYLKTAIALDPKNVDAYENLGVGYAMKKDFQSALAVFINGLQINPNSAKLNLNLGFTYMNIGQQAEGQRYINRAYELDPSLRQR